MGVFGVNFGLIDSVISKGVLGETSTFPRDVRIHAHTLAHFKANQYLTLGGIAIHRLRLKTHVAYKLSASGRSL